MSPSAADRTPEKIAVGDLVEPLGEVQESADSPRRDSPGRECVELSAHRADVGVEVERRAVVEERAPLRIERDQVELVVELAARLGEDSLRAPTA